MSGAPAENHHGHPIEAYSYVREWKCRVQFARLFVAALRQFERLGRDLRSEVAGLQVCLIGRKIRLIATVGDSDCQLAAYHTRAWKCRVQFARLFVAALRQFERLGRDLRSEVAGLQVCLIGRKIRLIATVGDSDCQLAAYHTRATA